MRPVTRRGLRLFVPNPESKTLRLKDMVYNCVIMVLMPAVAFAPMPHYFVLRCNESPAAYDVNNLSLLWFAVTSMAS